MSPPAASIDTRPLSDPNSDFNFTFENPNLDSVPFSSYFSINKNNQPSSSSSTGRTGSRRPRLVKQRRSCKTTSYLSGDVGDNTGINPFRSVSSSNADQLNGFSTVSDKFCSNNNVSNDQFGNNSFVFGVSNPNDSTSCCNGVSTELNNLGFVFGGSNSNNKGDDYNTCNNVTEPVVVEGSKVVNDTGNGYSTDNVGEKVGELGSNGVKLENGEVNGATFTFGASARSGVDFDISEELEKLKLKRNEKVGFGGEKIESEIKDRCFVFGSGGVSCETSGINSSRDDKTDGLASRFTNDNVFVFGSSVKPASDGDSISQSSSFSAEVDGGSVKDVLRFLFSSAALGAEVDSKKPEACSVPEEKTADCSFASTGPCFVASCPEFKLPEFDGPLSFSSNLPSESGRKADSSVKARGFRDKHSKKTKAKPKHSKKTKQMSVDIPSSADSVAQAQEAAQCFSPMDFSPYEETTATNDVAVNCQEVTGESKVENGTLFGAFSEGQPEQLFKSDGLGASTVDPSSSFSENVNSHDVQDTHVAFNSDVVSEGQEKFAFTASTPVQNDASSHEHRQKKKYRMKSASVAGTTARVSSLGRTPLSSKLDGLSGNFSAYTSKGKHEAKEHKLDGLGRNFSAYTSKGKHEAKENKEKSRESAFSSAEKDCDKWRKRGNEAYENGNFSKADYLYSLGVNSIAPGHATDAVFAPLVCCYSNRAAARMYLGRVREAVQDCLMAVKIDPTFHRAQIRAANCYLQLGEFKDAIKCFGSIIELSNTICLDMKVRVSASEGIQMSQKVIESINRSAELLRLKTSDAAASALELIAEALSVSTHSEKLLELKAEALCMLRRHDEALELCQQSRDFAEKNFTAASSDDHEANDSYSNLQLWRQRVFCKCCFHLGRLEEALDHIEKEGSGAKTQESSDPLAVTIRELLREKNAGNTAFQSGKHLEAIEHYTTAILSSMDSRPFAAICFCNRAAAHQALGHIADAISDCSLAIALDENYAKAVSRRASLHQTIRDYRQAAIDLQRIISLLEKQSVEQSKQSGSGNGKELRLVQNRLSVVEEEAKRDTSLDLYLILGVNKSDPSAEIKKAYRKAALRHHPDKAGQSLVRSDGGDEGRHWKDIAELVHKDSDRLFKMIGEAYAVLSDPKKREEYDEDEDMRKALKERNNFRSTSRRHSEHYYQGYPYERSSNRRYWQDGYTYSYSSSRW